MKRSAISVRPGKSDFSISYVYMNEFIEVSKLRAWTNELRAKSSFAAHKFQDGVEELKWHPTDRNQLATCSLDKTLKVRLLVCCLFACFVCMVRSITGMDGRMSSLFRLGFSLGEGVSCRRRFYSTAGVSVLSCRCGEWHMNSHVNPSLVMDGTAVEVASYGAHARLLRVRKSMYAGLNPVDNLDAKPSEMGHPIAVVASRPAQLEGRDFKIPRAW